MVRSSLAAPVVTVTLVSQSISIILFHLDGLLKEHFLPRVVNDSMGQLSASQQSATCRPDLSNIHSSMGVGGWWVWGCWQVRLLVGVSVQWIGIFLKE